MSIKFIIEGIQDCACGKPPLIGYDHMSFFARCPECNIIVVAFKRDQLRERWNNIIKHYNDKDKEENEKDLEM